MKFELTSFQILTPGLYTGDPIKIAFNYRVTCSGWTCYAGWMTKVLAHLDGQTVAGGTAELDRHNGVEGGHDGATLVFTGLMPNHDLSGELAFEWKAGGPFWGPGHGLEFARMPLVIVNLDDITPDVCVVDADCPTGYRCENGKCVKIGGCAVDADCPAGHRCVNGVCIPAVTCIDGETQCRGDDLYICQSNKWKLYEEDSPQCGYEPPPYCTEGEVTCVGTSLYKCRGGRFVLEEPNSIYCGYVPPTPSPPGEWLEKYKWVIIGVSVAVVIGAIVFIRRK